MRQEVLAAIYDLLPQSGPALTEQQIYYGIEQMLGVQAAGNPMAGWRQRLGRDLGNAEWVRIYDVIGWTWSQFQRAGLQEVFRENINRVLAAHGVVWELEGDGRLHRVLPVAGQAQVAAAFAELTAPQYAPALALANAAGEAYDARPRRDRDACRNIFDAMESVAKEKYGMPNSTFGQVVGHIRQAGGMNEQVKRSATLNSCSARLTIFVRFGLIRVSIYKHRQCGFLHSFLLPVIDQFSFSMSGSGQLRSK
jgi:hypothetical protein